MDSTKPLNVSMLVCLGNIVSKLLHNYLGYYTIITQLVNCETQLIIERCEASYVMINTTCMCIHIQGPPLKWLSLKWHGHFGKLLTTSSWLLFWTGCPSTCINMGNKHAKLDTSWLHIKQPLEQWQGRVHVTDNHAKLKARGVDWAS